MKKPDTDENLGFHDNASLALIKRACLAAREWPQLVEPLDAEQADRLLREVGPNTVFEQKKITWYSLLYHAFVHPFNFILLLLAVISGATLDFRTLAVMIIMVSLSVFIRFFQEWKSENEASKLKSLVNNTVQVIRLYSPPEDRDPTFDDIERMESGELIELTIPLEKVVPGDIVRLVSGNMIPGDVELLVSNDLFVSQAALTGESMPVMKYVTDKSNGQNLSNNISSTQTPNGHLTLSFENPNNCFMGASVVSGKAIAIVRETGKRTMFAAVARSALTRKNPTAFQIGIRNVSFMFMIVMACAVPLVFVLVGALHSNWYEAFLFSISVAVGLTPEMLPMIVNANLAVGAYTMSKKKTIVKVLESIINLGAMDILCTDKTGTLTQDKIALVNYETFSSKTPYQLFLTAFLNAHLQTGLKNLLDFAIVDYFNDIICSEASLENVKFSWGNKEDSVYLVGTEQILGTENSIISDTILSQWRNIDEIPFDFVRRRVSVIVEHKGTQKRILMTKGAIEEMLSICDNWVSEQGLKLIDEDFKARILEKSVGFNEEGLRVLAVAFKVLKTTENEFTVKDEYGLSFLGLVAFLDPPKESAEIAIRELMDKGIEVKVLTGDNPAVCEKVCKQISLPVKSIVVGKDLEGLTEEEFFEKVKNGTVFAKLTPLQKAEIVKSLKSHDKVVGFLGDGINDAPAIRESDVGLSVDTAVDMAKETADMILLEKSLLVLATGVEIGRLTYGNTMKYIKMAVSGNFGNIFSLITASAWLPFIPMEPTMIVLQNLLYDLGQTAIPWDNMDKDFLMVPHKWSATSIMKFMAVMGPISSLFDILTFAFMFYYMRWNSSTNENEARFQTGWFMLGLFTQQIVIHVIRSDKIPIIGSNASLSMYVATILVILCGLVISATSLGKFFGMASPYGLYYVWLISAVIMYCVLAQIVKKIYIKVFKEWI